MNYFLLAVLQHPAPYVPLSAFAATQAAETHSTRLTLLAIAAALANPLAFTI